MDVAAYLRRSAVLVVVGKGGVGKTTVAAALAALGAAAGLDVLLVSLDEPGKLAALFGHEGEIGYEDTILQAGHREGAEEGGRAPGRIRARLVTSDAALLDYLETHGLKRVTGRLLRAGAVEVVATAIPGLRAVLVLGKIRQLEQSKAADLIVVDAPATGHALSFLSSAAGLAEAARGGPLHVQAEQVAEMVTDPRRCEVALVTLPEELPVNEAIETAFRLEDEVGVALGPLVVNACYRELGQLAADPSQAAAEAGVPAPAREVVRRLEAAAEFRRGRQAVQREQLDRLSERLGLKRIELPLLFETDVDRQGLATLARALAAGIARLS